MSENTVVVQILKNIQKKRDLLYNLDKQQNDILNDIKIMQCDLWDKCKHEWVRDYNAPFDDLCKWFCKHCTLYNDRRHYNN